MQQYNEPAADTANFTFNVPGVPNGWHPISVTGLPAGILVPIHSRVHDNILELQLANISRAAAGTHPLTLVVHNNNGDAVTVPIFFTLTTTGSQHGTLSAQQTELRLAVGNTAFTNNGLLFQNDAAPFIAPADNRLMVPLRVIAEGLGAQVAWIGETNTVHITNGATVLNLTIGVPLPNGMGTPVIIDGRTFVPVQYVAEMLGATVRWDGANSAMYIIQ